MPVITQNPVTGKPRDTLNVSIKRFWHKKVLLSKCVVDVSCAIVILVINRPVNALQQLLLKVFTQRNFVAYAVYLRLIRKPVYGLHIHDN